jgi:hypothetical protein
MAEAKDIMQILSVISEAFPNFKQTELTPEVYYQCLNDIPTDELKAAVLHCVCQTGRAFAPSIGEIRGAVADIRRTASNTPSAYEAWQIVCRAITEIGSYGSPQFESPLIDRVVRNLGWRNLCLSENQVADRARFLQAYEQLLERATKEEMLLPEVRHYIEERGAVLLDTPNEIKQLSARLTK